MTKESMKKIIITLGMLLLLTMLFTSSIFATDEGNTETEWTDFANAQISIISAQTGSIIKISGVEIKPEHSYEVWFSHTTTAPTEENAKQALTVENKDLELKGGLLSKYLEQAGDVYIWVNEKSGSESSLRKEAELLTKKTLPFGEKFKFSNMKNTGTGFSTKISAFGDISADRLGTFEFGRIGKLADSEMLKKIKDEEIGLKELYDSIQDSADNMENGDFDFVSDITLERSSDIKDGEFYYLLLSLDGEEGKYEKTEDIMLYQAVISEKDGKNLYAIKDAEHFDWEYTGTKVEEEKEEEENKKDPTTTDKKIPAAGKATIAITVLVITLIAGFSIIQYKKYKIN